MCEREGKEEEGGLARDSRSQFPIASRKPPPPHIYLCSLVFMFSFTLKCRQQTGRQRRIGSGATEGKPCCLSKRCHYANRCRLCKYFSGQRNKNDTWGNYVEGGKEEKKERYTLFLLQIKLQCCVSAVKESYTPAADQPKRQTSVIQSL